ncbi:MAG: hypothetical protein H0U54_17595 [Acidobacteria bacterium]|nr:hypothetical protein [Acidobacteriota bacterium]
MRAFRGQSSIVSQSLLVGSIGQLCYTPVLKVLSGLQYLRTKLPATL